MTDIDLKSITHLLKHLQVKTKASVVSSKLYAPLPSVTEPDPEVELQFDWYPEGYHCIIPVGLRGPQTLDEVVHRVNWHYSHRKD